MKPSVSNLITHVFQQPLLSPFKDLGGHTYLTEYECGSVRWLARRDAYEIGHLVTVQDGVYYYTSVEMTSQEVHLADVREDGFRLLLTQKIKLLQMRHWFNLVYARGGYC